MIQSRHRKTYLLAAAFALVATQAMSQTTRAAPAPRPAIPLGNEMGFFKPQADPALTRFGPPTQQEAQAAGMRDPMSTAIEEAETAPLEERMRTNEQQMDRAEGEAARAREEQKPYLQVVPGSAPPPSS